MSGEFIDVETPVGLARVIVAPASEPRAVVVVGHGAGGGVDARDLAVLASMLPARGYVLVRVEQPWRVSGRRIAPAPAVLDRAWAAVVARLRSDGAPSSLGLSLGPSPGLPLVVAGRSAGARVACRTARGLGAAAVVALAFPLHPPGRPVSAPGSSGCGSSGCGSSGCGGAPTRVEELRGAAVGKGVLVVQGERDPFGHPGEFAYLVRSGVVDVVAVPWADHGFAVPKRAAFTQEEALATLGNGVADWLDAHVPAVGTTE